jgi:hypothetical protein
MRTVPVDKSIAAAAVAIEDEVLAHEAHRLDRIGIELAGACDRLPVAAQQLAHRRAGPDAGEHVVASGRKQAILVMVVLRYPPTIISPLAADREGDSVERRGMYSPADRTSGAAIRAVSVRPGKCGLHGNCSL